LHKPYLSLQKITLLQNPQSKHQQKDHNYYTKKREEKHSQLVRRKAEFTTDEKSKANADSFSSAFEKRREIQG